MAEGPYYGAMSVEQGDPKKADMINDDDEGRKGTVTTASAHIITAVIGSGVLSLAWAFAQLGWVVGPTVLIAFAFITYFTSTLLADCYRAPHPVTGKRNATYSAAVRAYLGGRKVQLCGIAQYGNIIGITIGYTITASISMVAVLRSNCFHKRGHEAKCHASNNPSMIIFGAIQIILSQIPNFHELSWLSAMAAVMSISYSVIGLALALAKVAGGSLPKTTLTGTVVGVDVTAGDKVWKGFQAIGNIAFAYAYATVLIEIQDTLKSSPPENTTMKKASLVGVSVTTVFYVLCGVFGYLAFGNGAPGNFLTGFGFYEPYWLIDFANACIALHLVGAYQVFCQPIYSLVGEWSKRKWPESKFINHDYLIKIPGIGIYPLNLFRLVWRTAYVVASTVIAMIFPFFNDILGLIGAASFFPLTVYFPIEMHIAQNNLPKYSSRWVWLKVLSYACLLVSLVAAAGSMKGLVTSLKTYQPFQTVN